MEKFEAFKKALKNGSVRFILRGKDSRVEMTATVNPQMLAALYSRTVPMQADLTSHEVRVFDTVKHKEVVVDEKNVVDILEVNSIVPVEDLEDVLSSQVVRFMFLKKNGEVRSVLATRRLDKVPSEAQPKGVRTPSPDVLTFWSIEDSAWRSCRRDNVIAVDHENFIFNS